MCRHYFFFLEGRDIISNHLTFYVSRISESESATRFVPQRVCYLHIDVRREFGSRIDSAAEDGKQEKLGFTRCSLW